MAPAGIDMEVVHGAASSNRGTEKHSPLLTLSHGIPKCSVGTRQGQRARSLNLLLVHE